MSESGVKNAVAQRVVRPHELQQWHRNWNGTPNRKVLRQHNIETAIEYLPRPRQWLSPLSASPAKMRAFYPGDDRRRLIWRQQPFLLQVFTHETIRKRIFPPQVERKRQTNPSVPAMNLMMK